MISERRFSAIASVIAASFLLFAGYMLWHGGPSKPAAAHETIVAWRCVASDAGTCRVATEIERCATCHESVSHVDAAVQRHADIGCVACHGGDGLGRARDAAHTGLANLGAHDDVPEVEARCAACHTSTFTTIAPSSPAKAAWAAWMAMREHADAAKSGEATSPVPDRDFTPSLTKGRRLFRTLRCGACHATDGSEAATIATPLDVLGLRGATNALVHGLRDHAAHGGVDLALDETAALAVATHLIASSSTEAQAAMVHRASAPGSSAAEGRVLYDRLACAACHDASSKEPGVHVDLAFANERSADWIAYFLSDPTHANAAATMPSLRLSLREAASLATHLTRGDATAAAIDGRTEIPCAIATGAETKKMSRDACGEAIIAASTCGACHTNALAPSAPSLAHYGETHDGATAKTKLTSHEHARFRMSDGERRDLATYLVAQRDTRVRPDLRVAEDDGAALFDTLGCAGCHALDDTHATPRGPSLFGEGLRTQPQWLFDFFRAPQRHPVRPPFHPEWAYRDLVPAEHVAPRMPTYALTESQTTSLVRFFDARDGAQFPFGATATVALAGEALTGALGDLTHKDRGACTSCHTITTPDVARSRDEGDKLAPALALAHERLRPAWIEACIMQPNVWTAGMPPFSASIDRIDRLRDLVLLVRDRSVLPAAGAEGLVPALGLGDLP